MAGSGWSRASRRGSRSSQLGLQLPRFREVWLQLEGPVERLERLRRTRGRRVQLGLTVAEDRVLAVAERLAQERLGRVEPLQGEVREHRRVVRVEVRRADLHRQ